mgnify:CR=1 FL=1
MNGAGVAVARRLLRYAWAAPCTGIGLAFALPLLLAGARLRRVHGVYEVALMRGHATSRLTRAVPISAITFGHVVIGACEAELARLRAHEHTHVRQYERWGALFFVAYGVSSLVQLLRGRSAYWHNHFEVQARHPHGS